MSTLTIRNRAKQVGVMNSVELINFIIILIGMNFPKTFDKFIFLKMFIKKITLERNSASVKAGTLKVKPRYVSSLEIKKVEEKKIKMMDEVKSLFTEIETFKKEEVIKVDKVELPIVCMVATKITEKVERIISKIKNVEKKVLNNKIEKLKEGDVINCESFVDPGIKIIDNFFKKKTEGIKKIALKNYDDGEIEDNNWMNFSGKRFNISKIIENVIRKFPASKRLDERKINFALASKGGVKKALGNYFLGIYYEEKGEKNVAGVFFEKFNVLKNKIVASY